MFRFLIFGVLFLSMSMEVQAQSSPHGADFAIDCAKCHSPQSWKFDDKLASFDHDSTLFKLTGQHKALECKSCHSSLDFKQVSSACVSCHSDFHQSTVGTDCARCHTPNSWEIANVTALHEQTSFPLMGVHATVNCTACHQSESNVRFSPTGMDCISCHRADYETSEHPDHQKFGFSTACNSCHSLTVPDWVTDKVDHDFFPLVEGHSLNDCASCHANGDYSLASPDCISCHQLDFASTLNPNHIGLGFSTDCKQCHS